MQLQEINSYSSFEYQPIGAEVFGQNVLNSISETKVESGTLITRQGERIPIKNVVFYFKNGTSPRRERIAGDTGTGKLNSELLNMESVNAQDVVILTLKNCEGTIRRACTRAEAEAIE